MLCIWTIHTNLNSYLLENKSDELVDGIRFRLPDETWALLNANYQHNHRKQTLSNQKLAPIELTRCMWAPLFNILHSFV